MRKTRKENGFYKTLLGCQMIVKVILSYIKQILIEHRNSVQGGLMEKSFAVCFRQENIWGVI